jgi:NADPH:quinone reductase-like Zn-dependent oxidoreductase
MPKLEDGSLRPLVDRVFDFNDLPAAIAFMESDAQVGKIVVRA